MKHMKIGDYIKAVLLTIAAAAIILGSWYIPFFIFIGVFLFPIPAVFIAFRYESKVLFEGLVIVLLIIMIVFIPIGVIIYLIPIFGLPSVVYIYCLKKEYFSFIAIILASVSLFLSLIIVLKLSGAIFGYDILSIFYRVIDNSVNIMRNILVDAGFAQDQINQLLPSDFGSGIMSMLLPGILAVICMVGLYISSYITMLIMNRLDINIINVKPLDKWYLNNSLSLGVFFVTGVTWLLMLLEIPNAEAAFNSIYIIFNFIFIIQGFAVISWFLKKRNVPGKVVVFAIIVLTITGISIFVFYLGLIDYIMDFRKVNPSRRKAPPGD